MLYWSTDNSTTTGYGIGVAIPNWDWMTNHPEATAGCGVGLCILIGAILAFL